MEEQFKPGARLQILNQAEQEYYMTEIDSVAGKGFTIKEPASGGKTLEMPHYSSWQFCLIGEDAVYFFNSKIIGESREGSQNIFTVQRPASFHRQQRRGYVRVPCHLNVLYWPFDSVMVPGLPSPVMVTRSSDLWEDPAWVKDYLKDLEEKVPAKAAFTLDMSGGGTRIVTLEPLERHDRLFLKIDMSEKNKFQVMLMEVKVVRAVPLNIGGWRRYRVGLSFVELEENVQERLIGYLFRLMRKKV